MRLLQLKDNSEFTLVEYIGKNIPRYAILSHTWGADHEEVTFRDLKENTAKCKAGYRKLTFCGQQAAKDGLQYFWVDTCCIDKSSSAELAEAINSMFRWYQNAAKCYVYLSDVSISSLDLGDPSSQQIWKPAVLRSRWFTRGWTLQELISPKFVEFFSVDGEKLGDKISLIQDIHSITGISIQALQGSPLSEFSIDERMSWAVRRETGREEDAVYSLLGIFDVYMPLLYGEGKEKALARLQKEIKEFPNNSNRSTPKTERVCITAISRRPDQLDLFLCGPDGNIYTIWWTYGDGWSQEHTNVRGDFPPGAKVTVVSMDAEKLDLFACDINGRILTSSWHVQKSRQLFTLILHRTIGWSSWSSWNKVGELFSGGTEVTAISREGKALHLFARAEDGQIHTLQWTKEENWSKNIRGHPLPRDAQGFSDGAHITITARTEGHMDLLVFDSNGNIKTLGWSSLAGWSDWELIGEQFSIESGIATMVRNESTLQIFACRLDGKICTTYRTADSGWEQTWRTISLDANFRADSEFIVTKISVESLQLFVHGSDGFIHTCWDSGLSAKWSTWESIGTQVFSGSVDVTAVVRIGATAVDLFVSNNEGQIHKVWWTRGRKSKWDKWRVLQSLSFL
ncbi:hypothetical protein ACMFMG_005257 [Clarireedia jacksonii]